jgi:hypothetical protein
VTEGLRESGKAGRSGSLKKEGSVIKCRRPVMQVGKREPESISLIPRGNRVCCVDVVYARMSCRYE